MTTMTRASLHEEGNESAKLSFHYNPTTLAFQRTVKFQRDPNQASRSDPPAHFNGVDPTSLTLALLFDSMESGDAAGVQPEIDRLVAWTTVPEGAETTTSSTPRLVFAWGRLSINGRESFVCHLEQLRVTCEMFDREGVPLRATVNLTLKSAAVEPEGTNPTSGTERSRRRRVLRPGQSLQAVAYAEYGDPAAWRAVAELNRIDNPMRLPAGTELLLPDRLELGGAR